MNDVNDLHTKNGSTFFLICDCKYEIKLIFIESDGEIEFSNH